MHVGLWISEIGAEINTYIEENFGIHTLGIMDRGARQLTCNKKVEKPEDLAGLKLRLPENEVYIKVWSALGNNSDPCSHCAYGSLYVASNRCCSRPGESAGNHCCE